MANKNKVKRKAEPFVKNKPKVEKPVVESESEEEVYVVFEVIQMRK